MAHAPKVLAAAVAAAVLLPATAGAQTAARGERIEVTGSSLKRIDGETALPVQILKREDIEKVGATTTEELLKQITAVTTFGSILVAQANGTITTSQSTVSLRALGSTRTLVLINGRRFTVFGGTTSTAVDVNSIPIGAIDRIEVLKEGASSLYGSDAIAGVVNFILRTNFQGGDIFASYGAPTRSGGGKDYQASAYLGYGDLERNRFNVNLGVGYHKQEEIQGKDRAFARQFNVGEGNDLSSTIAFPGNILFGPTFTRLASPAFPDCGPTSVVVPLQTNPASSRACRFENSPFLSVQSGIETKSFMLNARYALSGTTQAYLESGFTRNEVSYTTQPVPFAENTVLVPQNPYNAFIRNLIRTQYPNLPAPLQRLVNVNGAALFLLPPTSPFFPRAFVQSLGLDPSQPIAFRYRDFANGLRHSRDDDDSYRLVAGVKGSMAAWDFDSAFSYSESKAQSNLLAGYPRNSLFLELLDTGTINPFGPTTDPAALAAAQATEFHGAVYKSKTSSTGLDAKGTRELFDLRGGPVGLAVGGEVREERFKFDPSEEFVLGDIGGFGGNVLQIDRKRHIASVYSEIAMPFFRSFEADLGIRYDNYQRTGSTTNPKLSVRWQPTSQFLVRGSVGSGFRAPSLTDLYTPQAQSVTPNGTRDPVRCPNPATGSPADCNNQFTTLTGGNPDLKPEKSLSRTLGIVFEPVPALSVGVDAFWISLKDSIVIGGLGAPFLLQNAATATQFSNFIIRGAPDGNASGVGPIVGIVSTTSNLFKQKVEGADVDVLYRVLNGGGQRLVARLDGTYLWHFDQQNPDGSYTSGLDRAVRAGGGMVPRWKHVASLTYGRGPWEATVMQNYQKHYTDQLATFAPAGSPPRTVGSYETYDLQGTYLLMKSLQLALGVKNVFDRDPPYTNAGGQFAAGYDITYADVRGRFVYGSVRYRF
ncbi:MAG TPA: TonB-dependent receptor [Usitatibacter sp.]|nr:TonB-dependent receptor [Usitatibacter sp.]